MAICRIFLCTYRRNHLLRRALDSLLAQTVTDWVCELHNDDPRDSFPRQLVEKINDPRISIVDHAENLGPTRTFNLIFREVSEPFISLLEDDNWWQPNFLEEMIEVMEKFPEVHVAWANMRFWLEENDETWTDTGRNIWEHSETAPPELFHWPHRRQIRGALHSNGAMIVRSQSAKQYVIPEKIKFGGTEAIRERAFHFPILFVPQVLANFSITKETSRSKNRLDFAQKQVLLVGSFLKHVPVKEETLSSIWHDARSKPAKSTGTLFFAALIFPECRKLLKHTLISDWLFFIALSLKRPLSSWQIFKSVASNQELWDFLDQQTALRAKEAQEQGFKGM
ncbi:glycosyltransferase [Trichocoleus sp. ST-U3]